MKNILITGVSSGIGLGATRAFCREGYRVFGSVLKKDDAQPLIKEFEDSLIPLVFDVRNDQSVQQAVQEVKKTIGNQGLVGLINNAGIAVGGPLMHLPIHELQNQFEVNLFGLLRVTQAFLPLLGAQKNSPFPPGKIINMSSAAGKLAHPFLGPYVSSKHAVEGLSHSLRRELQIYGIDVIIVGPGAVKTAIWEKGPAQEINEEYLNTDYIRPMQRFQKEIVIVGKNGFPIDYLGKRLLKIMETKKPKTRYAIVPNKFKKWTLMRLIPDRIVDQMVAKVLGLQPEDLKEESAPKSEFFKRW